MTKRKKGKGPKTFDREKTMTSTLPEREKLSLQNKQSDKEGYKC